MNLPSSYCYKKFSWKQEWNLTYMHLLGQYQDSIFIISAKTCFQQSGMILASSLGLDQFLRHFLLNNRWVFSGPGIDPLLPCLFFYNMPFIIVLVIKSRKIQITQQNAGADPAAGKGGAKLLTNDGGSRGLAPWRGPGGRAPWWGLQEGRAPLRRDFWTQFAWFGAYFLPTSYWKSLDLFPIKVFFFFFFLFELWNRPI